jgi:Glycosyltransferase sugar-binding region containing DXD motif/Alpha 1,4-glycosyltransferase conserved region
MTVVQTFWIGATLPSVQQLSIRSFLAHGHEYHLYTYGPVHDVPEGTILRDASEILPSDTLFCYPEGFGKGSYSAFSNLFRYQLLFERGGWWVDTDVVCLREFDFRDDFIFSTQRDTDDGGFTRGCATSVFKARAGAPFLKYCVDVVRARDKQTLQWGEIGPTLLDEAVNRFALTGYAVPVEVFNPIDYFDFGAITEPGFELSRIANSYAVHLWNQMWKSRNIDLAADPAVDSLYGILRRRYA